MKKKLLLTAGLFITVITVLFIWNPITPAHVKTYFEGFGAWTLLVYVFAYAIAVWIPSAGTIMTVVGGLLFGPVKATSIVITLSTFASILPFMFARTIAREKIKRWITKKGFDKYAHKVNKNSFSYVLYLRLLPILPYELQNYLIGLTNISMKNFIIATFIGLFPGTLALAVLGDSLVKTETYKLIILGVVTLIAMAIPFFLKKYGNTEEILEEAN